MNLGAPELVFLVGFVVYVAIRGVYKERTKRNAIIVRRFDGLEIALLALVLPGSLILPLLYLFTPWLNFANYSLPTAAAWCGYLLMPAALWLFWRSHHDLDRNWSQTLELREDHQLITRGVYRTIRHPMYASIFLWSLAQGLLLRNCVAGWSALITFIPLYLVRTPREERMMIEAFGDDYRAYVQRTGRLLPHLVNQPPKPTRRKND